MAKRKPKIRQLGVGKQLSQEQDMMQELFSGRNNVIFGSEDSESLPRMDGILRSGGGLIKNDDYGETGSMFGIK